MNDKSGGETIDFMRFYPEIVGKYPAVNVLKEYWKIK